MLRLSLIIAFASFIFSCRNIENQTNNNNNDFQNFDSTQLRSNNLHKNKREEDELFKLTLLNNTTNTSLDFHQNTQPIDIKNVFGKPDSILNSKEKNSFFEGDVEEYILYYKGLTITFSFQYLCEIDIYNDDWKLSNFSISDNLQKINFMLFEKQDNTYKYHFPSKVSLDGIFYVEMENSKIIHFGWGVPCT